MIYITFSIDSRTFPPRCYRGMGSSRSSNRSNLQQCPEHRSQNCWRWHSHWPQSPCLSHRNHRRLAFSPAQSLPSSCLSSSVYYLSFLKRGNWEKLKTYIFKSLLLVFALISCLMNRIFRTTEARNRVQKQNPMTFFSILNCCFSLLKFLISN